MSDKAQILQTIAQIESLGGLLYLKGERVKYRPVNDPRIEPAIEKLRPHRDEVARVLRERQLAPCGSVACGGCYEVWPGVKIHPPKASAEWQRWRERWTKVKQ